MNRSRPRAPGIRGRVGVALSRLLVLAAVVATGCAYQGLSFRVDDRVDITAPEDREAVSLPVTIEWDVTDFEVTGKDGSTDPDSGYFAVFLDRAPQPPGEAVAWFANGDRICATTKGCPDRRYLAVRGVYEASETTFVLPRIPEPVGAREGQREFHEVTVVLLDGTGRRIGESAYTVQFEVDRTTAGDDDDLES